MKDDLPLKYKIGLWLDKKPIKREDLVFSFILISIILLILYLTLFFIHSLKSITGSYILDYFLEVYLVTTIFIIIKILK